MLINKENIRFERLKLFLAPYPYFQVDLNSNLDRPLEFKQKDKLYEFKLSPLILKPEAPIWIESSILSCALTVKRTGELCDLTYQKLEDHFKQQTVLEQIECKDEIQSLPANYRRLELKELWLTIRMEYFPQREDIDSYKVIWSRRKHTSCLASCNYYKRKVIVAESLSEDKYYEYLEPLLYHEMCHAIIGKPEVRNGRRVIHGREFKLLERRHPDIPKLDAWIKAGGWHRAVKEWEKIR